MRSYEFYFNTGTAVVVDRFDVMFRRGEYTYHVTTERGHSAGVKLSTPAEVVAWLRENADLKGWYRNRPVTRVVGVSDDDEVGQELRRLMVDEYGEGEHTYDPICTDESALSWVGGSLRERG